MNPTLKKLAIWVLKQIPAIAKDVPLAENLADIVDGIDKSIAYYAKGQFNKAYYDTWQQFMDAPLSTIGMLYSKGALRPEHFGNDEHIVNMLLTVAGIVFTPSNETVSSLDLSVFAPLIKHVNDTNTKAQAIVFYNWLLSVTRYQIPFMLGAFDDISDLSGIDLNVINQRQVIEKVTSMYAYLSDASGMMARISTHNTDLDDLFLSTSTFKETDNFYGLQSSFRALISALVYPAMEKDVNIQKTIEESERKLNEEAKKKSEKTNKPVQKPTPEAVIAETAVSVDAQLKEKAKTSNPAVTTQLPVDPQIPSGEMTRGSVNVNTSGSVLGPESSKRLFLATVALAIAGGDENKARELLSETILVFSPKNLITLNALKTRIMAKIIMFQDFLN